METRDAALEPPPEVVLIPGLHGTTALFGSFSAEAPAGFRCHAMALPTDGEQDADTLAGRLANAVPATGRLLLVGESFGGPVATRLAQILGPRVELLILSNPLTAVPIPFPAGLARRLMRSRAFPTGAVSFTMAAGDRALAETLLAELCSLPPETLERRLAAASRAERSYIPDHASGRMLTLLGTADRLISPSASRKILAPIPGNTVVEIDAPHLLLQTRPAEAWAAIAAHARRVAL